MEEEKFYHIYNRANGFENLFISDENYNYFLRQWAKHIEPVAQSYAYCLMPNHFHFLAKIRSEEEVRGNLNLTNSEKPFGKFETFQKMLSKQFSNFFSSYTQAFNKMHGRKGSLFIPNFKKKEITSENYLTNVIFYIHHNPVHHGFANTVSDWAHSSYPVFMSNKETKIDRKYVYDWFGGLQNFKSFHTSTLYNLEQFELELT